MKHFFYSRLAMTNLKNNKQTYVPYVLTSALSVMMFYMIDALNKSKTLKQVTLHYILNYSTIIIGFFAVILLFYTNSFLIKRRKKELGVYHILGMGKPHIAKMMAIEVIVIAIVSIGVGLLLGISFGKLMYLILLKILHSGGDMHFAVNTISIARTALLFGIIFFMTFIYNLLQVQLTNPIELLHGGQIGEKEPKTKWFMTLVGIVAIGIGYTIALTTASPLEALTKFFLAVLCVIIGTYALFTAGSIVLLKGLKKNKSYYYHPNHFTSVSGMLYRMKQNAVGLANICILSTMVLVMISTTVSLYAGMEDILRTRFPHEVSITIDQPKDQKIVQGIVDKACQKHGVKTKSAISYQYAESTMIKKGTTFSLADGVHDYSAPNTASVVMLPLNDYNEMEKTSVTLKKNEVLMYRTDGSYSKDTFTLGKKTYHVVKELDSMEVEPKQSSAFGHYYIVFSDIKQIKSSLAALTKDNNSDDAAFVTHIYSNLSFNISGKPSAIHSCIENLQKNFKSIENSIFMESRELSKQSFYELYGGIFFMGIYLGAMFLIATVLIIYYKQISEGYDDRERYQIMQKVGMSKQEVRRSIKSQVLSVFFLPLIVAIIHIAVAFKVIVKLLAVLNLTNVTLFALCTVATVILFGIFYAIIYAMTAREYYRIVN